MTCIYGLIDPRTNELKYIGKSKNVLKRYRDHCNTRYESQLQTNIPLVVFLTELSKDGLKPKLRIFKEVEDAFAVKVEREYINKYLIDGYNLLNGDSPKYNPRTAEIYRERFERMRINKILINTTIETLI